MPAIIRYEFRMQMRRPAFWIILAAGCAFIAYRTFLVGGDKATSPVGMGWDWSMMMRAAAHRALLENFVLPVVAGVVLADRYPRDRRLGTAELLSSTPVSIRARLWGKLLGAGGATAMVVFAYSFTVTGYFAVDTRQWFVVVADLLAFLAITLPALLFVSAFSTVATALVPVPVYVLLLTGYWFWGNLVDPASVPTLSCTLLSPIGGNVSAGLFDGTALYAGACAIPIRNPTAADAIASLSLIILIALLVMLAGQLLPARQRSTR